MNQIRITVAIEQERDYLKPEEVASESFVLSDTLAKSVDVRNVVGETIANLIGDLRAPEAVPPPDAVPAEVEI